MTYRIGRGETGVLTFEPYKSEILPLWRFATPQAARKSAERIWEKFEEYAARDVGGEGGVGVKSEEEAEGVKGGKGGRGKGDFVGMDMCRKFLQMVSSVLLSLSFWCGENGEREGERCRGIRGV